MWRDFPSSHIEQSSLKNKPYWVPEADNSISDEVLLLGVNGSCKIINWFNGPNNDKILFMDLPEAEIFSSGLVS